MKLVSILIYLALLTVACGERCADCHMHDPVTGASTNHEEICGKGSNYLDAVEAKENLGHECHEV